jgi:hypothetical protein
MTAWMLGLGALCCAPVAIAHAQSSDPFRPSLEDPRNPQRFNATGQSGTARAATATSPAAGVTGFDATGSVAKRRKRLRPGERNVGLRSIETRAVPPLRGLAQQEVSRPSAPQLANRATYADVYRSPDQPAQMRRQRPAETDPFDPVGVRAGDFVLRPSIELGYGHDTNASRVPGGRASSFMTVAPELQAKSEWSRHEATLNLRGSYSRYEADSFLNRPSLDGKLNLRIDASRDTRFDIEGRAVVGTDNPGSPNVGAGLAKLPVYTSLGGTLGAAQQFNRLELSAKALFDRTIYQNSQLTDGSSFDNRDRNYNQFGGQLRASYEIVPGLRPFVEVGADRRSHDEAFDRNGLQRDSSAWTPRAGAAFAMNDKLTGEVSVGYVNRTYKDPALKPLKGIVADGSLAWKATGLTTATLSASSRAEESVVPGVSGALKRDAGLQVDHAFRRWLVGTARIGYGLDSYVGLGREDTRTSLGVALTYKLSREFWLKGEVRQDWLRSNVTGVDYDATVFSIGAKLQR